ncbi:MAG TPA: sn-glycerol-3-phosphate ABC transporter ATP-binding protein UgpC [Candidatus Acidoferrales bacterium]|nr:sn-glycerol-3-phosphate ABC transporter ATP-binding protein UgpC [Candidatus Acidoferrales bacterium]
MASAKFEHVDKVYPGGTRALTDCTLRIDDGELLVCVGPSGCGKSTLLRLLAGLELVTSGTIRIGDRVVNDLAPQERNVAMVFQDYALYPFMSVRRNLEFPLKMRKLPRDEMRRRVEWAAGLLDIAALLDRLPKQLSGGQRQRVAMGRALVREPTVFLLDEPLSNLDAKLRVQVRAEIGELQRRTRTTMIYVTHDQVEAMTLGDRVAVLNAGRLQQVAAPRELYDRPANVFVAGFVGNPPMNLFPARPAVDEHGRSSIAIGSQSISLGVRTANRLKPNQQLTGGIRPEALVLATQGSTDGVIRAQVEHVEYLGHETLTHVTVDGGTSSNGPIRLIARLQGMHEIVKGQPISLQFDSTHLYLFDADGTAL